MPTQIVVWVVLAAVLVVGAAIWSYVKRFRAMCRAVRDELREWVPNRFPGVSVVREEMGNLVVRLQDGTERTWEMADVYASVAQLGPMSQDPTGRSRIYEHAAQTLFPPEVVTGPLSVEAHAARIKPRLVRPMDRETLSQADEVVHTPVPELGLELVYALDIPPGDRVLNEADLLSLGWTRETLHGTALENLRRDFPAEMVAAAPRGDSGSAIQLGDGFDAARLLLIPEHLAPDQKVVALLPHRDLLVLLPPETGDDLEKLRQAVDLLKCEDHPPLLARAVRVTRAGFELI